MNQQLSLHLKDRSLLEALLTLFVGEGEVEVVAGRALFQADPTSLPLQGQLPGLSKGSSMKILKPEDRS